MALERHRYKGTVKNGTIRLEPGAFLPDGAEVIVLFDDENQPKIRTLGELLTSEFTGMLSGRSDLPKTTEEFRDWRRKAWERHTD